MKKRKASGSTRCARISTEIDRIEKSESERLERERRVVKVLKRTLRFYERDEREDCANPSSPFPPRSASNHRLTKKYMFIVLPRCAGTSERSWPWSVRRRSRRRCSKLNEKMIKRGNKVSTCESAREENLWLRWKQNSETKIRPLETHTDTRTQTHAQTHFERRERKNTNAKKAQHGNKREREKERKRAKGKEQRARTFGNLDHFFRFLCQA